MKKTNKKGFTIVELVIVIAVIAILAAVMIPTFGGIIKTANESAVKQAAAATYKQVFALDMSDGINNALNNGNVIGNIDGVTQGVPATAPTTGAYYAYAAKTENNKTVYEFTYVDYAKDLKAVSTDGTTWTVSDATPA